MRRARTRAMNARRSAAAFIGVSDIRGSILYTKSGTLFAYLRIQPVSIDLLSERERDAFVRSLTAEFSSERKPFRFFCISRPVEVAAVMGELSMLHSYSADAIQKELLRAEMATLNQFALSGEVIERQFFLILWEKSGDDAEMELLRRASDLRGRLERCLVYAELLNQNGIAQLCNLFANPAYAHLEDADMEPSFPLLNP